MVVIKCKLGSDLEKLFSRLIFSNLSENLKAIDQNNLIYFKNVLYDWVQKPWVLHSGKFRPLKTSGACTIKLYYIL
jgi:hypothetical protein